MNLINLILKEYSKTQQGKIVTYVGNSPARFSELVSLFLAGPYRVTQRAALPLSRCVELHPGLIQPHFSKILNYAGEAHAQVAVKRNVIRLLQFVEIPKRLQGRTATICFQFFTDKKEPIAVRVFSMTVLAHLAKGLPDLKNELIPLIEDELLFASAGFISRGRKVLQELKK
jgi:hypothetical protein